MESATSLAGRSANFSGALKALIIGQTLDPTVIALNTSYSFLRNSLYPSHVVLQIVTEEDLF